MDKKRPSIGVVIATPGRASILRTLNSILYQGLEPDDDVLIVGDGYHKATAELVEFLGWPFRYVATEKTRTWGHDQINYGLKHVQGDWLLLQDDDDIFCPRAFDEARDIIMKLDSPRPVMGRVMSPYLGILWKAPATEPLDGHCLLVPNDKAKLGYVGLQYAGDQDWIQSNLKAYDAISWADRIWSYTRPEGTLWPKLWESFPHSRGQVSAWSFHHDVDGFWDSEPAADLIMARQDKDYWLARLTTRKALSLTEYREIVEFATQAGQGSDVWFKLHPSQRTLIMALVAAQYELHSLTDNEAEYVFEWPPKRFEPPVKEEQDANQGTA